MRQICRSWMLGIIAAMAACDTEPGAEAARGTYKPSGKADEYASCAGWCDDQAPAGCWCDAECEEYGDCCADRIDVCEAPGGDTGDTGDASMPVSGDCHEALSQAGVSFEAFEHEPESPAGHPELTCEIDEPVLLHSPVGGVALRYFESTDEGEVLVSCETARSIVGSAAVAKLLGATEIIHMGTYNCRTIAGKSTLSEHATGRAIDVAGFTLDDGTEITVLEDWEDGEPDPQTSAGQLLRGFAETIWGKSLWNVILTPEFNAAHDNHLHLDLTPGGNTFE